MIRFLTYILLSFLSIAAFSQQNDIYYYNFVPDTSVYYLKDVGVYPADTLSLDFNSDGDSDLSLFFSPSSPIVFHYHIATSNENWQVCWASTDSITNISNDYWLSYFIWNYDIYAQQNFGIRYFNNGNYNYGWFRAYVTSNDTAYFICVDKMAYCNFQNYDLIWGQTDTSTVPKIKTDDNRLSTKYDNNTNYLIVNAYKDIISHLQILNSSGQLCISKSDVDSDIVQINLINLKHGVYILRAFMSNGDIVNSKFVK